MKAFLTGVNGQDGSYLAEYLLELGYEVHGLVRRHSVAEDQTNRIQHIGSKLTLHYGDMSDAASLAKALADSQPDEIYNLGGMSQVRISFDIPSYTLQVNTIGVLNLLQAAHRIVPGAKLYQASSSEMFGNSVDSDGVQRLGTPMNPVSPYGVSKLAAFHMVRQYRETYSMFACNGILFNHESPRRGSNFVTAKIVKGAVEIKRGLRKKLELGNLSSFRDWGHSKDYVRAMHAMLQYEVPSDWIVATGESHSIREFCKRVFEKLDLSMEEHVVTDPKYLRPSELHSLRGDPSRTLEKLNWRPTYSFEWLIDEMVNHWLEQIK